jgi:hypothetical protein
MKINKEEFIKSYNATGKGTSNKIPCTRCQTEITAFGSNLAGKIAKAGSLEILLDTFTCRSCKSEGKVKVVKVTVKREKKEEKEEPVYIIPKMKGFIPTNAFLKDTPELVQSMTNFSCVSPQYYLDHGRKCTGCVFADNCNCALKKAA